MPTRAAQTFRSRCSPNASTSIVAEADAEINIDDDGSVHIYSNNGESLKRSRHDHIFQQLKKSVVSRKMHGLRYCWAYALRDGVSPLKAPGKGQRCRAFLSYVLRLQSRYLIWLDVHTEYVYRDWNSANKSGVPPGRACRPLSKGSPKSISNTQEAPHCENRREAMLSPIWNVAMTHRSIRLPDLPAVSDVRRYSLGAVSITCSAPPCDRNSSSGQLNKDLRIFRKSKSNRASSRITDTARRR